MSFALALVLGKGGLCLKFWTGLSILVTAALRLGLLGFCLSAPNAIFVSLFPTQYRYLKIWIPCIMANSLGNTVSRDVRIGRALA